MNTDKELDLLDAYMKVYIQLLPYCIEFGGKRLYKNYLPTFEYFKQTLNDESYSLSIPHYKESKIVVDKDTIVSVYTRGMGSVDGIGYRYYNYWMGCKYFTHGNICGKYNVITEKINNILMEHDQVEKINNKLNWKFLDTLSDNAREVLEQLEQRSN